MSQIKLIIFDGGGTVWYSMPVLWEQCKAGLLSLGLIAGYEDFPYSFQTFNELSSFEKCNSRWNLAKAIISLFYRKTDPEIILNSDDPNTVIMELIQKCRNDSQNATHYEKLSAKLGFFLEQSLYNYDENLYPACDGILQAIPSLHVQGFKLALLSNRRKKSVMKILQSLKIEKYFHIVEAPEVDEPEIKDVNPILKYCACEKEEALFIGDSNIDISSAKTFGLKTVAVLSGMGTERTFRKVKPDYIISKITEIDRILDSGIAIQTQQAADNENTIKICGNIDEIIQLIIKEWKSGLKPVFLTGAGVSASAGVSLWEEIKRDLYKDLFDIEENPQNVEKNFLYDKFKNISWLQKEVLPDDENDAMLASRISDYVENSGNIPPELMLSFFRKQYGLIELQNFLGKHFERYTESISYISLIRLIELNIFRFYLTLNQDGACEKCLLQHFSPARFLSLVTKEDFEQILNELCRIPAKHQRFLEESRIVIANLHGVYYKPYTLQISPKLLISPLPLDHYIHQFVESALETTDTLIIIGYKGADVDIAGILKDILKNRNNFRIIWVEANNSVPELLRSNEFSAIERCVIYAKADEFLSKLAIKCDEVIKHDSTLIGKPTVPDSGENFDLLCSAPGSVIIAGDYGVYINGKMIQLQVPLRVYGKRIERGGEDKAFYYDPYFGEWIDDKRSKDKIQKTREFIEAIRESKDAIFLEKKTKDRAPIFPVALPDPVNKMLQKCRNELKSAGNQYEKYPIHIYSQYPSESGCGDALGSVIIAAMIMPPDEHEFKLEELDRNDKRMLVMLSRIWAWLYSYFNASYLRVLPSFWNGKQVFLLDRKGEQKTAFSDLFRDGMSNAQDLNSIDFMQANLLIDTFSILANGKEIRLDAETIDFAIAYYPRRIILTKDIPVQTATQVGVYEVDYQRDRSLLEVMAQYAAEIENINDNPAFNGVAGINMAGLNRIGKIMSACHSGFVTLGRGSRLVNKLVGILNGQRGIYGAKTSGGGPGGALVIAYNPKEINLFVIKKIVDEHQHKLIAASILNE